MIRPPPAGTPAQSVRTSPPQAERSTNRTSRGRIIECLATQAASLSPACKEVLAPFAAQ